MDYIVGAIASVLIVIFVFAYLIVRMALKHEEKRMALKAAPNARVEQILAETQKEMAKLRDRVQVLERLATDEDRRVASEIRRLGDTAGIGS
ncbi:MAG TPA: hypothetical protein VFV70_04610 [Hyphomonadaceae bacterium]|nr:hypothetical protein [Hyphomonadaceae bacterium]